MADEDEVAVPVAETGAVLLGRGIRALGEAASLAELAEEDELGRGCAGGDMPARFSDAALEGKGDDLCSVATLEGEAVFPLVPSGTSVVQESV